MANQPFSLDLANASVTRFVLEHGSELNAALLDVIGALVCLVDRQGHIVRFNRACERLCGYTIDEVNGRPFWDVLVPKDEVDRAKAHVDRLLEERRPTEWDNHWLTKSGELRHIHWSNTVLEDASRGLSYLLGTGIDITEERRAREMAEQAEGRAAFLAEASRVLSDGFEDPTWVVSELAHLAVPYLASWCAIRVVGEDKLLSTLVFTHVDPKKQARLARLERRVFTLPAMQALPAAVVEGRSLLVNGGTSCLEHFSAAFPNLEGAVRKRAAAILRDAGMASFMMVPLAARGRLFGAMLFVSVDERCQYGPVQLGLAETLAARAGVALDNTYLYLEARRALQAREDFLVVASHELKTPLTTLQVAVQALLRRADAGACASLAAPLLRAVKQSTDRLGTLSDELLDIARFTANPPVPSLEEVDLRAVVAEAVERSTDALARAGCALSQVALGPTEGRWDRPWLVRIVGHLLSNAAKYGAGHPIEIRIHGDEHTVRLVVRDHGIGISPEEQARIFERFERAVSVRHYGGFGLGLWLVRRLVETLGGAIRVESCWGEGATFAVELPRHGPSGSPVPRS